MEAERFSAKNCIKSQLASVISDLEHMTSGNFMHHRASAKMLAECALKNVDKVIVEERERCIKAAIEAHCKLCSGIHRCRFDGENYRDGNGFICRQPDVIKEALEE